MSTTQSPPAAAGLSTADLDRIRDTVAGGRKPKVMFTSAAGQIAGQVGQVVRLDDPATSDEWLVVRFGHDELPFSPRDLTLPPRGAAKRQAAPQVPTADKEPPMSTTTEPAAATAPPAAESTPAKKTARSGAAKTARGAKTKPAPGLTVTLAYQDGEWTVAAQQGSKVLAKPYLIKPSEALKIVGLVDVPGVQEAVEQLVAAERAEAEQRAEQLRAQLAELEAHLAELREAD